MATLDSEGGLKFDESPFCQSISDLPSIEGIPLHFNHIHHLYLGHISITFSTYVSLIFVNLMFHHRLQFIQC